MAGTNRKDWEDLNITREEVENLKEALKKDEFRKLLAEYAEEITNPENRKQYQDEIIQLEAERGVECTFVDPEPGFVVKTSVDGKKKAFVNICKNKAIGRPSSKPVVSGENRGLSWSIPFSQSPAREDHDNKRNRCVVYDVVFHPDTLHFAEKNGQFRKLVIDTALSAIEDNYKVKLDKKNLKYPKLKFKGIPVATVIRKKAKKQPVLTEEELEFQKNIKYPAPPPLDDAKPIIKNYDPMKEDKGKYTVPKYVIKHRTGIDLQEFTYDKNCKLNAAIPKELVIEVNLPLLNSTKQVTLDVTEKSIHLICEKPAKYKLDVQLPYSVIEEEGNAKFDKDKRILIITLPVIKAKMSTTDLMREDSGVESDFGERSTSCDDSSPIGSITTNNVQIKCDADAETSISMLQSPFIFESASDLSKTCENAKEASKPFRTSFLDKDKAYIVPSFKCNVDDRNLCFVLNVKNVDPKSLTTQMIKTNGCHLKFTSIGSGFFPVFYAFLVRFQDNVVVQDFSTDVWDNNVTLQICLENSSCVTNYYVGIDEENLTLKDLSDAIQIERKLEELKLDSKFDVCKYTDEKDDDNVDEDVLSVSVESTDLAEVALQILPEKKYDDVEEEEEDDVVDDDDDDDDDDGDDLCQGGEDSKLEALESSKKSRTFSESSSDEVIQGLSPVTRKSILKNRICRSLSESNAEDYPLGSSMEASESSDLCIPEEGSHGAKKTVRFNDRIRKQIFRANSSILGQKKKNQKRSRNKRKGTERRTSESENSECDEKEREKRTKNNIKGKKKGSKNSDDNSDTETRALSHPLIEEIEEKKMVCADRSNAEKPPPTEYTDPNEIRFMAKKNDKIFEFKSDLIFDLDL